MKKILATCCLALQLYIGFAQETILQNPNGRTLRLERNDEDSWMTFHDPGQYWYSLGIDRSNSGALSLNSGGSLNSTQFVMEASGNVGIGTSNPGAKLHVHNGNNSYGTILANADESNFSLFTKTLTTQPINTETFRLGLKYLNDEHNGYISFYRGGGTSGGFLGFSTNGLERLRINQDGSVGIGTAGTFGYQLAVNGTIGSTEMKVESTSPWPDFVFDDGYELLSLEEVEQHIAAQGHLPEVPDEAEVTEHGINLGEMDARLLQKIEELTLYIIDMNKQIQQLQTDNEALKEKFETHENQQ